MTTIRRVGPGLTMEHLDAIAQEPHRLIAQVAPGQYVVVDGVVSREEQLERHSTSARLCLEAVDDAKMQRNPKRERDCHELAAVHAQHVEELSQ